MARTPIHPGEILADELEELGLSAKKLADVIEVPANRLYQILAGKRNVTADTALRLSRYFGTSADFWMNLQSTYELDLARQQVGKAILRIPTRVSIAEGLADVKESRTHGPFKSGAAMGVSIEVGITKLQQEKTAWKRSEKRSLVSLRSAASAVR